MVRRLEELEARREQQERAELRAWAEALSDAELEAQLEERMPGFVVAYEALSDADRERLIDGRMPDAEFEQHRQRAQRSVSGSSGAPGPS